MNSNMTELEVRELMGQKRILEKLLPPEITLDGVLAEGGQGIIYTGKVSGKDAAIKFYFPGQIQMRVEREIEALKKLNNSHIVPLLWSHNLIILNYPVPIPSVATALIPGEDLRKRINDVGHLKLDDIGTVIYDTVDAIKAMWELRIVHRDLKPENILIQPNGHACVIDLGVARHIDRTPLTAIGFTCGTWGYMSPEQTQAARQLTYKSDLFALGIISIECALGTHPTNRDQLRMLAMDYHEHLPTEIASWGHADILKAMLHPRPTRRPSTQAILDELNTYSSV